MKPTRGPPSSGIPLPRSLLPSSPRADSRHRAGALPRPSTHTPRHAPTQTPTYSPSLFPRSSCIPGPSSRARLRDASPNGQLFQRPGALPVSQASRSACSSPLSQHRVAPVPQAKGTPGVVRPAQAHAPAQFLHHGNCNRNTVTNNNQTWGSGNLRGDSRVAREDLQVHPGNLPVQSTMRSNSNLQPSPAQRSRQDAVRHLSDSTSQSDEEMGTPEDSSPASSPGPLPMPRITFTMPEVSKADHSREKEAHTHRVNMAAVAPFSYR